MASIDAICAKLQPKPELTGVSGKPNQCEDREEPKVPDCKSPSDPEDPAGGQKGQASETPKFSEPGNRTDLDQLPDLEIQENPYAEREFPDSKNLDSQIRKDLDSQKSRSPESEAESEQGQSSSRNKRKNFKPQMLVKQEAVPHCDGGNLLESQLDDKGDREVKREEMTSPESSNLSASVSSPLLLQTLAGAQLPTTADQGNLSIVQHYDGFIVRYLGAECGFLDCHSFASIKEHFHCKRCDDKLFTKKDEMLRHFKWHRKRDESLAQGFMRFSANDNCAAQFPSCSHNMRQTHYHCLQDDCDRVYISTSDVQMHSNSHRKAAHIAREGFQRFKASEDCGRVACAFSQPRCRTTHFHCLRPNCSHSFKNKSDMDKHKAHHVRDEQFMRDGFKKFMKSDHCPFLGCLFSRMLNHTHCIRPGCTYVLHSTSQMHSHKRKHEKEEKAVAEARPKVRPPYNKQSIQLALAADRVRSVSSTCDPSDDAPVINLENLQKPIDMLQQVTAGGTETQSVKLDLLWTKYVKRFTANDQCNARCAMVWSDHYHCVAEEPCNAVFRNKDGAREHGWKHQTLAQSAMYYNVFESQDDCGTHECVAKGKKHFHCNWPDCKETILAEEPVFKRLEHFQWHERQSSIGLNGERVRKRGRPPKNSSDLYIRTDIQHQSSEKPKTSPDSEGPSPKRGRPRTVSSPVHLRLEPGAPPGGPQRSAPGPGVPQRGAPVPGVPPEPTSRYLTVRAEQACAHANCALRQQLHYHCNVPNCYYAMNNVDFVEMHVRDFHDSIEIPDGFACYDRTYPCGYAECPFEGRCRHFHCMKATCRMPIAKFNLLGGHVHSTDSFEGQEGHQVTALGTFFPRAPISPRVTSSPFEIPSNSSVFTPMHPLFPMPASLALPFTVEQICGNPYCKLKKQVHHHCKQCSKGFVDGSKLQAHLAQKHGLSIGPHLYPFHGAPSTDLAQGKVFSSPTDRLSQTKPSPSRTEVNSLIQNFVQARVAQKGTTPLIPCGAPGLSQPSDQEPMDLRQSILDTLTGKSKSQSLKKFKIHMYQPELMKFTTAPPVLSSTEYASINESLKSVLVSGNMPPHQNQKRYKFVDLTPSEALLHD